MYSALNATRQHRMFAVAALCSCLVAAGSMFALATSPWRALGWLETVLALAVVAGVIATFIFTITYIAIRLREHYER